MLNTVVAELDRTELENQGVNLSVALTKIGISLVGLPGAVATPYSAASTLQSSSSSGSLAGTTPPSGLLPPCGALTSLLLSPNLASWLSSPHTNSRCHHLFML